MSTPGARVWLSLEELATAAGVRRSTVVRLVRLGVLAPHGDTGGFEAASAARLRRMLRLHVDLGMGLHSAAIVADLMERIESLEREMARMLESRGG